MQWNEPLYAEGSGPNGTTGILILHGFSGSPRSLQELAGRLVDAGYSVALPLLTGHGRTPEAMAGARWTEWTADAEQAYQWLRSRTSRVFVCGLSMGGTLALRLAAEHPEIAGIISINTITRHPLEWLMHVLGRIGFPRWMKAIRDDAKAEGVDEKAYPRIPTRSYLQLARLLGDVRGRIHRVSCPALVYSSANDHVVPPATQRALFADLPSTDKTFIELEDSYHLATMDCDKEQVFAGVLEFVAAKA